MDEGIELLTGLPAGARGADGKFPEGTVHAKVEERLLALARLRAAAEDAKKEKEAGP